MTVIITQSLKELEDSYCAWKNSIKSKSEYENNEGYGQCSEPRFKSLVYGVCFIGVGVSSILCTLCNCWVHKHNSGLKKSNWLLP